MRIFIENDKNTMAQKAASAAANAIRSAITTRGEARIIVATGASQFEFLSFLVREPDIDWSKVTGFHLDEYIGLSINHPASFRNYMRNRFVSQTPSPMKVFNEVNGEAANPSEEIKRLESLLRQAPIDVACVGIGENGHLAFNDPPADFDTNDAYCIVKLDEKCRNQQIGEGWFKSMDEVPTHAFSMTIKQIMWSREIICTCPDKRKAEAVKGAVEGRISNLCPASILQMHSNCSMFLDADSASLLNQ